MVNRVNGGKKDLGGVAIAMLVGQDVVAAVARIMEVHPAERARLGNTTLTTNKHRANHALPECIKTAMVKPHAKIVLQDSTIRMGEEAVVHFVVQDNIKIYRVRQ